MAKDYFQDIVPPSNTNRPHSSASDENTPIPIRTPAHSEEERDEEFDQGSIAEPQERSIRNIPVAPRAPRRTFADTRDTREMPPVGMGMPRRPAKTRWWIWGAAAISVIALALILFVALRPTMITVTPRAHAIAFDQSAQFTAYPAATAAAGALKYSVQSSDLEDSEVVASSGTVHASDKASGNITIYNDYLASPMRLIATTRFATADGLIFRVPAEVVVPAKVGNTPGQVTVTVQADQPGASYNVPPTKFTLPGLKSSASYAHVYAQSTAAMTGGFVGDKPGVEAGAMQSAVAAVRGRIEAKAHQAAVSTTDLLIFPDLMQITYQDLPTTDETGGGVRIHESAHVAIPAFAQSEFAQAVAQASNIDTSNSVVTLVPGSGFGAHNIATSTVLGTDPLQFNLTGSAQIVWTVDTGMLTRALAGKPQASFQSIIGTIPSIQEARARVEPFWKNTFPANASSIKVDIVSPQGK